METVTERKSTTDDITAMTDIISTATMDMPRSFRSTDIPLRTRFGTVFPSEFPSAIPTQLFNPLAQKQTLKRFRLSRC